MNYKHFLILIIILIFTLGAVSASQCNESIKMNDLNDNLEIDENQNSNLKDNIEDNLELNENNGEISDEILQNTDDEKIELQENNENLNENKKTFSDVGKLITNTPSKGTVKLSGTYVTNGNRISISDEITIDGGSTGATLDGKGKSGILSIDSKNVVVKNIKFINGKPSKDDYGNGDGGAVYLTKGSVKFIDCTFQNNRGKNGFAVFAYDSYMGSSNKATKKITFENCKFINNYNILTAEAYNGGYVLFSGSRFLTTLKNCLFENNVKDKYSYGCVQIRGQNSLISNCIFNNNKCHKDSNHATVSVCGKNTKIINSKFNSNTRDISIETDCTIKNSIFKNTKDTAIVMLEETDDDGIELYKYPENIIIDNCKFYNCKNSAIEISYAYDHVYGPVYNNKYEHVTITKCYFKSCSSTIGGAIYLETNTKTKYSSKYTNVISQCTFIGNSAEQGGAIYAINAYHPTGTKIVGCIFDSNKAKVQKHPDGSSVSPLFGSSYCGNVLVSNNFWGFNALSIKELIKSNTAKYDKYNGKLSKMSDWVKIKLTKKGNTYQLRFVNNKGKLIKLPKFSVSITQRNNGKLIAKKVLIKNGVGTFKSTKKLTIRNINILNKGKSIINKINTNVNSPKITANYKQSKNFKITIKDKFSKKAIAKVKIKIKIYTGKKAKAYILKTNKKGVATFNTKILSLGSHNVIISSWHKNYRINGKSIITIK